MASGRATAREGEDEVGPQVRYQAGDVLSIVTRPLKKADGFKVDYRLNGKVYLLEAFAGFS